MRLDQSLVAQVATTLASTLFAAGFVGVWLRFLINRGKLKLDAERLSVEDRRKLREEERSDFQLILDVVTRQRDEAVERADNLEEKVDTVELEVAGLRLARDLDPFPNWIVDLEGRYIYANREFEREFLEPKGLRYRQVIGKRHEEVWGADFAAKMHILDETAKRRPDRKARATLLFGGRQITVHKFPILVRGVPVSFAGFVTDIEAPAAE